MRLKKKKRKDIRKKKEEEPQGEGDFSLRWTAEFCAATARPRRADTLRSSWRWTETFGIVCPGFTQPNSVKRRRCYRALAYETNSSKGKENVLLRGVTQLPNSFSTTESSSSPNKTSSSPTTTTTFSFAGVLQEEEKGCAAELTKSLGSIKTSATPDTLFDEPTMKLPFRRKNNHRL